MSLIPNSWYWKQLKLSLTCFLCCLPIFLFFLIRFYLALIIFILWSIIIIKNAYFNPLSLNILYARFFFEYLLDSPDLLSQLRPLGLDLFNTQLHDYSISFHEYEKKKLQKELTYLHSFKNKKISSDQRESYDVMEYFLNMNLRRELSDEFDYHNYLINQMMGPQFDIISFITKFHRILKLSDAEAYLIRVQRISKAFDQLIDQQLERRHRNIETPRFVLQRVIDGLEAFQKQLRNEPNKSPLIIALIDKLNDKICSNEKQNELISSLLKIIKINIIPAYDRLLNILHEDLSKAKTDHGVWKLPNGNKYYKLCLEFHTTTNMSPDEIHDLGKKHVERIQNEMRSILKEKQIESWYDFRTSITNLEHDIEQKYENIEENRTKILNDYHQIIEDIDNEMDKYFSSACRPATKCVVERIPQFKEATAVIAHYFPAALDGKTPGTFFVNLRNIDEILKFKMRTLAYHEAVPGHHFQISVAQSLKHLPFFRRMVPFTAYMEGWALYTEQLAAEKGFHKSWYSYLGYLDAQLFRSCRLVVDTGIHWKQWSREQAIDYMIENTCMKKEEIITEVERYFVYPGQACAYMIGCQVILSLREKVQRALGDKFDLKQFHDVILLNGSLPLNMLENIIDEFIKTKTEHM
ncbi:unnamed protein product [Rotaria sordida]|uniref:DUF885 domain-containing protein n=1 Tax=Rotaria sordida TaxID=392033 RepID=A0A814WTM3_9BILA|nr:unnamed protein product [Rotaria sordida]CAF1202650.1 unnamed protein product [Rotaria sordida]